jgi:hypothetical protein
MADLIEYFPLTEGMSEAEVIATMVANINQPPLLKKKVDTVSVLAAYALSLNPCRHPPYSNGKDLGFDKDEFEDERILLGIINEWNAYSEGDERRHQHLTQNLKT